MRHRNRGVRPFALAGLVASVTLAACSTGSGSGGSDSGGGSASNVSAEVTANVEKYKGLPEFTPPGDPIDPSSLKGKSMFLIPLVPNPFNQSIQDTMKSIADKVGMEFTLYPNQGKASEWVQGMNAAIAAIWMARKTSVSTLDLI